MFDVIRAPDKKLRVKTKIVKKITVNHHKIIKEMIKTTKSFTDPEGVGLASTQVGKDEQYFVAKNGDGTFTAIFNPKILSYSKKSKVYFEGCLSIPDYWGEVRRPLSVSVEFTDLKGQIHKTNLSGVAAWIFQHEYDHLQGKLFIDCVLEQKTTLYKVVGKDRAGAEIFEEVSV